MAGEELRYGGLSAKTSIVVRNFSKEKPWPATSVTRIACKHAGHADSCKRLCNGILMATAVVLGGSEAYQPCQEDQHPPDCWLRAAYFSFATCCLSAVNL